MQMLWVRFLPVMIYPESPFRDQSKISHFCGFQKMLNFLPFINETFEKPASRFSLSLDHQGKKSKSHCHYQWETISSTGNISLKDDNEHCPVEFIGVEFVLVLFAITLHLVCKIAWPYSSRRFLMSKVRMTFQRQKKKKKR